MTTLILLLGGISIGYVIGQLFPLKERKVPIPSTELHELYRQQMRIAQAPDLPPKP